ncbi:MAG: glycosyl hydrolase family 18 protein [Ignavibacteria bacterium]|nr:glycosyl hydrolase family 18 protein [Ignavibacteria bacterium]
MKASRLFSAWILLILTLPVSSSSQKKMEVLFAYRPRALETFAKHIDQVSIVSPETVVDENGLDTGRLQPELLKLAKEHNVKVMPQIKNRGFSQQTVHYILTNEKARSRTIQSMVDLCKQHGLWGMQVDFENVHVTDRDALTRFYREAAAALREGGYKISIAVVHRAEESPGPNSYTQWMMENWRGAFDLKALGEIGDFIKIMSYAQHTRRTTPGPSQGLPWVEQVLQYFLQFVPPEKLSLGITTSGSHYFTEADTAKYFLNARSLSGGISNHAADSLIKLYRGDPLKWDDKQKVLCGYFEKGGVFEWIFIDNDVRSFDAKLDLVRKYKLRGINNWFSGQDDQRIWTSIRDFRR